MKKLNKKHSELSIHGSFIDNLAKEIRTVRNDVINDYISRTKGHFKIMNDSGMVIQTKTEEKVCVKKSSLLAHILQGAESWILQNMIDYLGSNIVLLQHDGVTCREHVDTLALSNYIAEKTKYHVKFEIEKLALNLESLMNVQDIYIDHDAIFETYSEECRLAV